MRDRVLPDWLIVGTVVACLLGIAGLVGVVLNETGDDADAAKPTPLATATSPTDASPSATEPTPTETPAAEERTLVVSVFNQTNITGLAASTLDKAAQAGWPRGISGNWNGQVPSNTIYFPAGGEDQAKLLGEDLGITRVLPNFEGMTSTGLTVVMAGPQ